VAAATARAHPAVDLEPEVRSHKRHHTHTHTPPLLLKRYTCIAFISSLPENGRRKEGRPSPNRFASHNKTNARNDLPSAINLQHSLFHTILLWYHMECAKAGERKKVIGFALRSPRQKSQRSVETFSATPFFLPDQSLSLSRANRFAAQTLTKGAQRDSVVMKRVAEEERAVPRDCSCCVWPARSGSFAIVDSN
jgi:hypothetical protein